jgi:hypothetical protein
MKKQQVKRKATKRKNSQIITIGYVITDLILWDFPGDEETVRHTADVVARAIQLSYNLSNFGPSSFGISDEE